MTIEDKLKKLIIAKYGNLSNFSKQIDMANSTLATIMKNGIHKANVTNIIKICSALGISADELARNRIVQVDLETIQRSQTVDIREAYLCFRMNMTTGRTYTIDGFELDKSDLAMLFDALDFAFDLMARKKERETK